MTAVETTSTGLTDAIGISTGHLLARYGFSLLRTRIVAAGFVAVCGLAVVIRLKRERGRRRLAVIGLCALMAPLYALALVVRSLRSFYELSTPNAEELAAWAGGTAVGIGGMLTSLRLLRVW